MTIPRQFLIQMARDRELSPEQEEVFLGRFADGKEYDELAADLNAKSTGGLLKRMGQVYKKFQVKGATRGKENRLRIFLEEKFEEWRQQNHSKLSWAIADPMNRVTSVPSLLSTDFDNQARPEWPGGQVNINSPFYIERPPIELQCFQEIAYPGALIHIKAPRQMGKTSLTARILDYAQRKLEFQCAHLSLQMAEQEQFESLDKFLQWFCVSIGLALDRSPQKFADYQNDLLGSKANCTAYFEKYILNNLSTPFVLGLDEVDRIFHHKEIAIDFLGLLRTWHEAGKRETIWKNFRLVVAHSTEVDIHEIQLDINQSPFNVGLPIELPEFTQAQVTELVRRYDLPWDNPEIQQLFALVGGHPYLVRVALYYIVRKDLTLGNIVKNAASDNGIYSSHLRHYLRILQQKSEWYLAMKQVVNSESPVSLKPQAATKLSGIGLVKFDNGEVTPRCELYRQYFQIQPDKIE